jgi:hypothetical protein
VEGSFKYDDKTSGFKKCLSSFQQNCPPHKLETPEHTALKGISDDEEFIKRISWAF